MEKAKLSDSAKSKLKILAFPAFSNASMNPYNSMLYEKIRESSFDVVEFSRDNLKQKDFDIFHIHWPDWLLNRKNRLSMMWSSWQGLASIDRMRKTGTKVVWTIHNLRAHEQHYVDLENRFWAGMARRLDGTISFTQTGFNLAKERLPALSNVPSFVIPHGHYRDVYPNSVSRMEARDKLGLTQSAFVIAHVGLIRPYKNLLRLVRVFREIEGRETTLVIAGKPRKQIEREMRSAAMGSDSLHLFLRWIEDEELQLFFNAADMMIFPYTDILNSGSALLGLSFNRPVLVPRLGAMEDLEKSVGSRWVRTYDGDLDAETLRQAIRWTIDTEREASAPLDDRNWSSVARLTTAAYRTVVGNTSYR